MLSPGYSNQKTHCWSHFSPGLEGGAKQFQTNLWIQAIQTQTKSSGVFIINLTIHYYCAKYNSDFFPEQVKHMQH